MGRVVPKAELMDAVWPDTYVTEDSLTQSIREIRKAMGDSQHLIRTVSRRGYMLAAADLRSPLSWLQLTRSSRSCAFATKAATHRASRSSMGSPRTCSPALGTLAP